VAGAAACAPILVSVSGGLWGSAGLGVAAGTTIPAGAEGVPFRFAEDVAMAIANAEPARLSPATPRPTP
jgi:hypothetical protein